MKILKKEIHRAENYFSILIEDEGEKISFWIDCSLIDGYGNEDRNGDFLSWDFNKYIFWLEDEKDQKEKKYQENTDKREELSDFIDDNEYELVNWYKKEKESGKDEN